MHACALAVELGVKKVIVPKQSAVFSAWGMLMTDLRRDYIRTRIIELDDERAVDQINDNLAELDQMAFHDFSRESIEAERMAILRFARFRYQNQANSLEVPLPDATAPSELINEIRERFHTEYEREYTYRLGAPVEIVGFHVVAFADIGRPKISGLKRTGRSVKDARKSYREVDFIAAGMCNTAIYDGELLEPSMHFSGPAIVEESGNTTVVMPDIKCDVDDYGNIHIQTAYA